MKVTKRWRWTLSAAVFRSDFQWHTFWQNNSLYTFFWSYLKCRSEFFFWAANNNNWLDAYEVISCTAFSCRMATINKCKKKIIQTFQLALIIFPFSRFIVFAFVIWLRRSNHPSILVCKYSGCRYVVDVLCNDDKIIEKALRSCFDFVPIQNWKETNGTRQTKIEEKTVPR